MEARSAPIEGVTSLEIVGRGAHCVVFRARRNGIEVALKRCHVIKGEGPEYKIDLFVAEAAALSRIRHPGVVTLVDSGLDADGLPYLVTEYLSGGTLASRLTRGPLSVDETVQLLIHLSDALQAVHRAAVVHRDINPSNIVVAADGRPTLIDFGLAILQEDSLSRTVGTLAYTAPEQSGGLHLRVDRRADLYSLGAVAHECLTGRPPFQASDIEALLRMHARSRATPLRELRPEVPPILAEIVARLLSKDPDDRYPTAASLHWDLTHLSHLEDASQLARNHSDPDRVLCHPLRGRAEALAQLVESAPHRQAQGATLLVCGEHGSGVSRVGREFMRSEQRPCTALWARAAPQCALLSVVHDWLGQLATVMEQCGPEGRAKIREALRSTLGARALALLREFPTLSPWIEAEGNAPSTASPSAEQTYDLLVEVLACVGEHVPALTLAADDAQHLDGASLAIVRRVAFVSRKRPLTLLLMTHEPTAPELVELAQGCQRRVTLGALGANAAHQLVADFLGCPDLDHELSATLVDTSGGQPGALLDYMGTLLDGGALRFRDGAFFIDHERLQQLALPDDIAELALSKAHTLEPECQRLLGTAALYGGPFRIDRVAEAAHEEATNVSRAVTIGQGARLLQPYGENGFAFVDRRVSDWLSDQLEPETRGHAHRVYAAAAENEPNEGGLLRAATHRFHGADESTADLCIAVNRRAGERACERTAWGEARRYLGQARSLSERFTRPLDSSFYKAQALAHANGGDIERGFVYFEEAIGCCEDAFSSAELNLHVAEMHMGANFDIERMEVNLERCWRDLGGRLPRNTPLQLLALMGLPVLTLLMARTGWGVGSTRDEPKAKLMCRLVETTMKWAYLKNYIFVLLGMLFRPLYQALRVGRGAELAVGHAAHASTLASLGFPAKSSQHWLRKAHALAQPLGDRVALARLEYWEAIAESQRGNMVKSAASLETLLAERGRWMNINDYFFAAVDVSINLSVRGHNRRAVTFLERCLDDLVARSGAEVAEARLCRDLLMANRQSYERPQEVAKKFGKEIEKLANVPESSFLWFQIWVTQLGLSFETGDRDRYDEAIECGERSGRSPALAGWQFAQFWVHKGLCRAEQALHSQGELRTKRVHQLHEAIKDLKVPSKFPFIACTVELLQGWAAYFSGKPDEALNRLGVAEAGAIRSDNVITRFYVVQARATMLMELGQTADAAFEARHALQICEAHGWPQRATRIRHDFGLAQTGRSAKSVTHHAPSSVRDGGRSAASPEATRLRRERDALLDVGEATAAVQDPARQADIALDRLRALLGAERAAWCAIGPDGDVSLVAVRAEAGDEEAFEQEEMAGVWAQVRETRQAVVLNGGDEIAQRVGPNSTRRGVRSLICAPVLLRNEPVGVVTLDTRVSKGAFTAEDVDMLAAVATQIAIGQETARSMQRELQRQALDRDLQLSAAVQALLLPKQQALSLGSLQALGYFLPASRAAGDFWYAEPTREGRLRVLVGDVTGHGAGPAMVTAVLGGCYRGLVDTGHLSTPEVLAGLDHALAVICNGAYTVPYCAIELDPHSGHGQLWAGASPELLIRGVDATIRSVGLAGSPLGAGEGISGPVSFELAPGELLWLFSDGLNELPMPGGRELGMRRVSAMLKKPGSDDLAERRDQLLGYIAETADLKQKDDDLTFVLVRRDAPPSP